MTRCTRLHLQTKKKKNTFCNFRCNSITCNKLLILSSLSVNIAPLPTGLRHFKTFVSLMPSSGCKLNDLTTFNHDQTLMCSLRDNPTFLDLTFCGSELQHAGLRDKILEHCFLPYAVTSLFQTLSLTL